MIYAKDYTIFDLEGILNSRGKQAVDRKLTRYGIKFNSHGSGRNRIYSIAEISDPFKVFCITELGMSAGCDFDKMRYFFYYLFCADALDSLSHVDVHTFLAKNAGINVTRQTISDWINKLNASEYWSFSDYRYFRIVKEADGKKRGIEISADDYKKAWQTYFGIKAQTGDCSLAYAIMFENLGGHPYKKPRIVASAFYTKQIEELMDILNEWFLSQTFNK
jgi:hypothetical protein